MAVSKLLEHTDAPILRATAMAVYAYDDAVERYKEHIAHAIPFWNEDPSPGEEAAEAGNAVRKPEADGRRLTQLSWNLNAIHLGFKSTKHHLRSTGFSHFRRLREHSTSTEKSVGYSSNSGSATICNAGVLLDHTLKRSPTGIVWSGKIIPEDSGDEEHSVPVTAKVSVPRQDDSDKGSEAEDGDGTETTRHEARVFDFLYRSGKQDVVPRYHGIFERAGTVALVLGYNADEVLETFESLTDEQALKLFKEVVDMHAIGFRHNDLVPRNIIQDSEGVLRITDFRKAEMDHRCRGKKKCSELRELRDQLRL
ncbi:hypothetical protein DFH06DRAFT_1343972 [Mycena polygramma]|nr:hypothetical protein DFH06DRAFT_1343972 [Mycena polygramma]